MQRYLLLLGDLCCGQSTGAEIFAVTRVQTGAKIFAVNRVRYRDICCDQGTGAEALAVTRVQVVRYLL